MAEPQRNSQGCSLADRDRTDSILHGGLLLSSDPEVERVDVYLRPPPRPADSRAFDRPGRFPQRSTRPQRRHDAPVRVLFDRAAGLAAMLRNLLQRDRYTDLEAIWKQGWEEGRSSGLREGLLAVIRVRGLTLDAQQRALIDACRDSALLESWLSRAEQAPNVAEIFA